MVFCCFYKKGLSTTEIAEREGVGGPRLGVSLGAGAEDDVVLLLIHRLSPVLRAWKAWNTFPSFLTQC